MRSNPELLPINFEPVPIVNEDELPDMFDAVLKARRGRRKSFGAYVLRNSTKEAHSQCVKFMRSIVSDNHIMGRDVFDGEKLAVIHRDPGSRNSVTVHHTTHGEVDSVVLVGSKLVSEIHSEAIPPLQEARYLIELGLIGSDQLSLPDRALITRLGEDDLLIFDSSQPHVFRDVDIGRVSEVHYLKVAHNS